ncbi:NAD-glutamate dehydrogenase, partial [Klebsiella pneumoniae]|nr:NAD-glutamate dehydrogenase [Klebsiella pneumoniae]
EAAHGRLINWSLSLEESAAAQIRYTVDLRGAGRMPDEAALDERLAKMVRGWVPAVEEALAAEDGRATRLALRYADAFPIGYRTAAGP